MTDAEKVRILRAALAAARAKIGTLRDREPIDRALAATS